MDVPLRSVANIASNLDDEVPLGDHGDIGPRSRHNPASWDGPVPWATERS